MLNWLINLIPQEYRWSVAVKKVSYFAAKGAVALLMYGNIGKLIGTHLTPDQMTQLQTSTALLTGGMMEAFHDFLKLKFPNASWL